MARKFNKLLEVISKIVNKSPVIYSSSIIKNAQTMLSNAKTLTSVKCDNLVKHINKSTLLQDIHAVPLESTKPIPHLLANWWRWYQHLTGLDVVQTAKHRVNQVQDTLFKCQEERRQLACEVAHINENLRDIHEKLIQTQREDPKYVELIILENKSLREQTAINSRLVLLENEERDYFTQLATAIKDYHDSQSMHAQKYKYLKIISSAIITIISIIGAAIYNNNTQSFIAKTEKNLKDNSNRICVEILSRLSQKKEENSGYGIMKALGYVTWGIGALFFWTKYIGW